MTTPITAADHAGPCDYDTARVPGVAEMKYRDCYRSFGWTVGDHAPAPAVAGGSVVLQLRRPRQLAAHATLGELQRTCLAALEQIRCLQAAVDVRGSVVSYAVGLVGAGLLAGAVFLLGDGQVVLSTVLGVGGLVAWVVPTIASPALRRRSRSAAAPEVARLEGVVRETRAQAGRLLS